MPVDLAERRVGGAHRRWHRDGRMGFCRIFFLPFLLLLRIDAKLKLQLMVPLAAWTWFMRFCDQWFNIGPTNHPGGFVTGGSVEWAALGWDLFLSLGCLAFIGGLLIKAFLKSFNAHPPYPQRDPRMAESLGIYVPPAAASGAASHGGVK